MESGASWPLTRRRAPTPAAQLCKNNTAARPLAARRRRMHTRVQAPCSALHPARARGLCTSPRPPMAWRPSMAKMRATKSVTCAHTQTDNAVMSAGQLRWSHPCGRRESAQQDEAARAEHRYLCATPAPLRAARTPQVRRTMHSACSLSEFTARCKHVGSQVRATEKRNDAEREAQSERQRGRARRASRSRHNGDRGRCGRRRRKPSVRSGMSLKVR